MEILVWSPIGKSESLPSLGETVTHHILSYQNQERRNASCAAWNLLDQEIKKHGLPFGQVRFTKSGKPFFEGQNLFFSLSHSGKLCAVSLSDHPTGVDIENVKAAYDPRLIERSLSPAERESFDGNFARLWCRKEAAVKLTGEGILYPPSLLDTASLSFQYEEKHITFQDQKYILVAAFTHEKPTFV